jgi:predicted DNA-binding transcriptional regulator AlpA
MGTPQKKLLAAPRSHHIDRRADAIVAVDVGADDELLSTQAVANWLGVSTQWLEIGRHHGYGPKFQTISQRCIRYRRGDVIEWLKARTYASTAEYGRRAKAAA